MHHARYTGGSTRFSTRNPAAKIQTCIELVSEVHEALGVHLFVLPALQEMQSVMGGFPEGLLDVAQTSGPLEELCAAAFDRTMGSIFVLVSLLIDMERQGRGTRAARPVLVWLHAEVRRVVALRAMLESLASFGCERAAEALDPLHLVVSGALGRFWRQHFGRSIQVRYEDFLEAISKDYRMFDGTLGELQQWLRPEETLGLKDVIAVLDGPDCRCMWSGIVGCTVWPELCVEALMPVILTGQKDRHIAMTAADLTLEKLQKQRSLLLPGWTRARLAADRRVLNVLRTLSMDLAADADEGLLVRLHSPDLVDVLLGESPCLAAAVRSLLGESTPELASGSSVSRCIVGDIRRRGLYSVVNPREVHVAVFTILQRKSGEMLDCAENLLALKRQHIALLRAHLAAARGSPVGAEAWSPVAPKSYRLSEQDLHQESIMAEREIQSLQRGVVEQSLLQNADVDGEPEPEELARARRAREARLETHEAIFAAEINMCQQHLTLARTEMAGLQQHMLDLEASFRSHRDQMLRSYRDLIIRISLGEEELAKVSNTLASKYEALRSAEDKVQDVRMELAEKMAVPDLDVTADTAAIERPLVEENAALRERLEKLGKVYRRSKAMVAKRR